MTTTEDIPDEHFEQISQLLKAQRTGNELITLLEPLSTFSFNLESLQVLLKQIETELAILENQRK